MIDELLCLESLGDKKRISISKLLCRLTYFAAGFGISTAIKVMISE